MNLKTRSDILNDPRSILLVLFIGTGLLLPGQALRAQVRSDTSLNLELLLEDDAGRQETEDQSYYIDLSHDYLTPDFKEIKLSYKLHFLKSVPDSLLSETQLSECQTYAGLYGEPRSAFELAAIPSWNIETVQKILPFLQFDRHSQPVLPLGEMFRQGKHELLFRYQQVTERKQGYRYDPSKPDGGYRGIAPRLYLRYRFSFGTRLSLGLTLEQDPGEPFAHALQKTGVDYLSGHLFIKDRGLIRRLAVGDYEISLGQGLFLHQGFGVGKSLAGSVRKKRLPLRPHTSANESIFFRGIAADFRLHPRWNLLVFASVRKLDGNAVYTEADSATTATIHSVTSLQTSGLHRTESELGDKNSVLMAAGGGSLTWSGEQLRLSVQAVYFHLSVPLQPQQWVDNRFSFRGDRLVNAGLDYQYLFRNISLFGELVFSSNGGWSMINGGNFRLPGGSRISVAHRYYRRDFHALYPAGFGESGNSANENGIYFSLHLTPAPGLEWISYVDIYRHAWLRYGTDAPSGGIEIASRLTWRPQWNIHVSLRGRVERKTQNAASTAPIDRLAQTTKSSTGLQLQFRPADGLVIKTRIDYTHFRETGQPASKGIMAGQDIQYSFRRLPLTLYGRLAVFQTGSYDNRVYAYEHDVLYAFSVPAYHGHGSRYYIMAKFRLHRYIDCWVRWSQSLWTDRRTNGSGPEEIPSNTRSEIKCQLRIRF